MQSTGADRVRPEIEAIRDALRSWIEAGTLNDHHYSPATPIQPIVAPALAKALPHRSFYSTTLETRHFEYPEVEVALSISTNGHPIIRAMGFSPLYRAVDAAFLKEFVGAVADSETDQVALGNDIARLFAAMIYKGSVTSARMENGDFRCEIWWDETRWGDLRVNFVAGRVVSVTF